MCARDRVRMRVWVFVWKLGRLMCWRRVKKRLIVFIYQVVLDNQLRFPANPFRRLKPSFPPHVTAIVHANTRPLFLVKIPREKKNLNDREKTIGRIARQKIQLMTLSKVFKLKAYKIKRHFLCKSTNIWKQHLLQKKLNNLSITVKR